MQQIFFVFPKTGDEATTSEQQQKLLETVCTHAEAELSHCQVQSDCMSDPEFAYYLVRLPESASSEVEAKLKAMSLPQRVRDAFAAAGAGADKETGVSGALPCDLLFSEDFPCFGDADKRAGALVMDMDMTTVQIEGIDEIARCLGVFDEVAAITHEAMHGKLDFSQSLCRRVALLKGGDAASVLAHVKSIMVETEGLEQLLTYCNNLKASHHFQTCIASGGFHELISVIDHKYGLNKIAANRLEVDDSGKFTGKVNGPIVDGAAKAALVHELKTKDAVPQERIIVIGDGANDLLMMAEGGLGIAYHAKPTVQARARNVLNRGNLRAVAALLALRAQL